MDFDFIQKLRMGGMSDALALSAIGGSILLTSPFFSGIPSALPTSAATLGGAALAWRIFSHLRETSILPSALKLKSSALPIDVPREFSLPDGLLFGYTTDKGLPVWVSDENLMRHVMLVGQSGVGKTVTGSFLMFQQILRGGGVIFIDGKMNKDDLANVHRFCAWAGREHDLVVINPGDPGLSNTYNPILTGSPDEVVSRILGLIPSTETDAGADHYKQAANQGLSTLLYALRRIGCAYNFMDLTILLISPAAMEHLVNRCPPGDEKISLQLFLSQFRGKEGLDVRKMRDTFGGIAGRMYTFGTGDFGKTLNTYTPDVDLFEALRENRIIYVMLPTMGKDTAATNFGKMVIGDLRTAVSWLQALPERQRPNPPILGFFDEAGSYVSQTWARMFEQSRSARIMLMPAVQTLANLEAVSPELKEMVIGNTWTKLFFKLGSHLTAEESAELIGKYFAVMRDLRSNSSQSESGRFLSVNADIGVGSGSGMMFGERQQETYRVSPDDLKALDKGECVMTYGGNRVYGLRVPMIKFDQAFIDQAGNPVINRKRPRYRKGIDLFRHAANYLSSDDREFLAKKAETP
jgi:intracellular multiplication protein IcmO